ncbi:MAG: preprotein translocase subunit SecD [Xanthomonas sp.]
MRWMALGMAMALCVFGASGCGFDKAPEAVDASPVKARIEWRLASYAPSAGYAEVAYQGRTLYLAPQPALVVDGGASVARLDGDDGRPALDLNFPGHDTRLTDITAQNVGKQIALLADGQVLSVATIMSPLSGGSMRVSGLESAQAQQRVFALLTHDAMAGEPPTQAGKR